MKIYIATPVNGRKEATLDEKRKKAYDRVCELMDKIEEHFEDMGIDEEIEFHSSFDIMIAPLNIDLSMTNEAEIMGKCVQRVMECDMIVLDYNWKESRGCVIEQKTADVYGKELRYVHYEIVDGNLKADIRELVRVRMKGVKF